MAHNTHDWEDSKFEITSKRRRGFPSETRVKRGVRVVHGEATQRKAGPERSLPVRFRAQLLRTVASAPGAMTALPEITFFRE